MALSMACHSGIQRKCANGSPNRVQQRAPCRRGALTVRMSAQATQVDTMELGKSGMPACYSMHQRVVGDACACTAIRCRSHDRLPSAASQPSRRPHIDRLIHVD